MEGSPEIVRAFVAKRPSVAAEKIKVTRLALMNSDPWLKDLNSGCDDGHRTERFMKAESTMGVSASSGVIAATVSGSR